LQTVAKQAGIEHAPIRNAESTDTRNSLIDSVLGWARPARLRAVRFGAPKTLSDESALAALGKGQAVRVKCTVSSFIIGSVVFNDCALR
jgi:hypothetical protein